MKALVVVLMLQVAMAFAASSGTVAEGRVGLPISWQRRNSGTPGKIYTLHSKLGLQMLRVSQIWVGSSAADVEHVGKLTMKILKDFPAGYRPPLKGTAAFDKLETTVDADGSVTCLCRGYAEDDKSSWLVRVQRRPGSKVVRIVELTDDDGISVQEFVAWTSDELARLK
jgi:hypothetical protein